MIVALYTYVYLHTVIMVQHTEMLHHTLCNERCQWWWVQQCSGLSCVTISAYDLDLARHQQDLVRIADLEAYVAIISGFFLSGNVASDCLKSSSCLSTCRQGWWSFWHFLHLSMEEHCWQSNVVPCSKWLLSALSEADIVSKRPNPHSFDSQAVLNLWSHQ